MVKPNQFVSLQMAEEFSLPEAILKTLLYFDIFHHPLRSDEVLHFLGTKASRKEVQDVLRNLCDQKLVYQFNEFYAIDNSQDNVTKRVRGNELALQLLPDARKKARLIGKFPFVKSVLASGSLSKGLMDKDSDFDFFIITRPERLWITRMLLVLYKVVFLSNSHKYWCINYFVTTQNMEIEEKNQFTATELATVLPLYGEKHYTALMNSNLWVTRFFPNYERRKIASAEQPESTVKKILEGLLNFCAPRTLDNLCMRIMQRRWRRMYEKQYSQADFKLAFKTKKNTSKNHPRNLQIKILDQLELKWKIFQETHHLQKS